MNWYRLMKKTVLAVALCLISQTAQAGCSHAPEDGPLDTQICSLSGCEDVRVQRTCSTTEMVFTEYSNGWAFVERLRSPWAIEVWKGDRELTPTETEEIMCRNLPDNSPCFRKDPNNIDPANFDTAQDSFEGLCLDVGSGGCTERFLPFGDRSIGLCEEDCTFDNPVRVRDMNATLYDVTCQGDHIGPNGQTMRVLFKAGKDSLSLINFPYGTRVVPCN